MNPPFDSHFLPLDARDHHNKCSSNQISNCRQDDSNVICNNCGVRVHLPFVTSRFANVEVIHTVETIPAVTGTLNAAYAAIRVSTAVCYMNGDTGVSTSIFRNVAYKVVINCIVHVRVCSKIKGSFNTGKKLLITTVSKVRNCGEIKVKTMTI